MIDPRLLETATARGIVTPDQAQALGALASELAASDGEPLDRERLRFVTGFSDIFVTIGIGLFVGALVYFGTGWVGHAVTWVATAMIVWGLAEIFTARRRQALPSIALLVLFAASVFAASAWMLGLAAQQDFVFREQGAIGFVFMRMLGGDPDAPAWIVAAAAAATALAVLVHYARFAVPITVAVGVGALGVLVVAALDAVAPGLVAAGLTGILLALGVGVFTLAMRVDLTDPERVTRRTDIAFWLHLLAAPLIVHPLIGPLVEDAVFSTAAAVGVLALFLALAAVALVVDRRAILVSGLVYAGAAVATLVEGAGLAGDVLPLTLLTLGAFVLLLSVGWVPLRGALLRLVPEDVARRLPRPVG